MKSKLIAARSKFHENNHGKVHVPFGFFLVALVRPSFSFSSQEDDGYLRAKFWCNGGS
jgi:hypothetical protein